MIYTAQMVHARIELTDLRVILIAMATIGLFYGLLNLVLQLDLAAFHHFVWLDKSFIFLQQQIAGNILFFYAVFFIVPVTLTLESIIPVNPKQGLWSVDATQDLIWLFLTKIFHGTFVVWYAVVLYDLYDTYLSALTIESLSAMPAYLRFLMGILLIDFSGWFHHLIRHKVSWFWHFHAVHHSQKQMNLFTDFRVHFVDYLIAKTLVFIPLFMLSFETPEVIIFALFNMFYTRFYHGNLRTNLGWLKYILVTPQSHRIHHSILEKHRDKNFGVIFSIWDRVFGTHLDDGSFPATGIDDETFPFPKNGSVKEIVVTLVKQFIYPFTKIYRDIVR